RQSGLTALWTTPCLFYPRFARTNLHMASDSHQPGPKTPRTTPVVQIETEKTTRKMGLLWPAFTGLGLVLICASVLLIAALALLLQRSPPVSVTIVVSGTASQVQTSARTVGDVLRELAIPVNDGDNVSPSPDTVLSPNMVVSIERSRAVTVTVD